MKYYIIKREDKGANNCPYYKEKGTWCSRLSDAEQFTDAVDAEYVRKRLKNDDDRRVWIVEVTLIETEIVVMIQPIGTRK